MKDIERQTKYLFITGPDVNTDHNVTIDVSSASLRVALDQMLRGTDIAYEIRSLGILLSLRPGLDATPARITGVVVDAQGKPVVGASVLIEGTSMGTSTDPAGHFALTVPAPAASRLVVNFLGYEPQTLHVGSRREFEITLRESTAEIESVVVTALGIKRSEKALAYTVAQVKAEDVTLVKDANFINALSGKVAGAVINQSSSGVGGATQVIMRGMKSIMQTSNALYVVDGVPMFRTGGKGGMEFDSRGATESIADLNPEDIASISVMTGAAASALYGSEAANGVVLITTRRGEAGRLQVHVSSTTEFLSPLQMPEFQSRYGTGRRGKSTGSTIHSWGERLPVGKRYGYSPQDDFLETGHVYTNSFSLQGGSEKNQTYFSAAAVNSDGLTPNNEYNRYNFTFRNTSHFLRDRLTLDAAASYVIQQDRNMTNQGVYSNPLVSAYLFPRGDNFNLARQFERWNGARNIYEQYWPQGEGGDLRMQNPYWIAYRNPRENERRRYMLTASVAYKILDWLDLSARLKADNTDLDYTQKLYATSNPTLLEGSKYGYYTQQSEQTRQTYGDVLLNVNKTFRETLSLAVHAGASLNDARLRGLTLRGPLAKPSNVFHPESIEPAKRKVERTGWHEQTQSLFYSLEVGWKSQLYLTHTGRNDWASQLAGSPQSSFFYPSVGVSWLPSATFKFPELFPYLKIRASWASVGTPFPRDLTYATHPYNDARPGWDEKTNRPIGDLYPERTKTWELGLDARFLRGFTLTASWYRADTCASGRLAACLIFSHSLKIESNMLSLYPQTMLLYDIHYIGYKHLDISGEWI
ncbi:SusC/RagA family TonB-linked outer membrane protein [Alistipes sp.]|uniref:SusC/RagA family TonB-linked outer membrane protein n=1 Tax=Alistipes sp. TaxID=1872444 RepID=UPI003AB68A6A